MIILIGLIVRIYFHIGHVFSDDGYYSYLSYTVLNGSFTDDYLGYPVFPLRIGFIYLNSLSMMIFGSNEFATIVFPFFFSLANILLVFKVSKLFTSDDKIAYTAAFFVALFPTDVVFASIGFPDLINLFFINVGIYFLLKAYYSKKTYKAYIGGSFLFISMQFKETVYYLLILLIFLLIYFLLRKKQLVPQILIGVIFILLNYFIEGFIYLLLHNDFFYRIAVTNTNYSYSYYDFFPYTAQEISGSKNYIRNLFDQIIMINAKSVFLRRFYLFLPIVASIQTYFNFKKNNFALINFWFWGTSILLIAFTTSLLEYKPLDLARSWYIFPLLMPTVILSAIFINRFSKKIKIGLIIFYTLGSSIMCFEYKTFFDVDNLNELKSFLRDNSYKMIYTDHFTKYSIDLIRSYQSGSSERILENNFDFNEINIGDWIIYNEKHINELILQKYQFPDFSTLDSNRFKKVETFNDFIIYEKLP